MENKKVAHDGIFALFLPRSSHVALFEIKPEKKYKKNLCFDIARGYTLAENPTQKKTDPKIFFILFYFVVPNFLTILVRREKLKLEKK